MRTARPSADASRLVLACLGAAIAVMVMASPASAQQTQGLRIVPIVQPDQVLVSFQLADGFTDEVRDAIRSGLRTTFTYTVDLWLDVPGWVDRKIGTSTVTLRVEYSNLTRRYAVDRLIDGRNSDSLQTEDELVVRKWLTSLDRAALFRTSLLVPNREYYIRVGATARPSNGALLWPFGSGTSAQTKFTFVR